MYTTKPTKHRIIAGILAVLFICVAGLLANRLYTAGSSNTNPSIIATTPSPTSAASTGSETSSGKSDDGLSTARELFLAGFYEEALDEIGERTDTEAVILYDEILAAWALAVDTSVEEAVQAGDYRLAFDTLHQIEDYDAPGIRVLYNETVSSCGNAVTADAEAAYKSGGCDAALALLYAAPAEIAETSGALIAYYDGLRPVLLSNLDVFSTEGGTGGYSVELYQNEHLEDRYGTSYSTSFSASTGDVKFLLNNAYKTFSGTVGTPAGYGKDDFRDGAYIEFLDDDGNVLYRSELCEVDTKPQSFTVDVAGVELLTIRWTCIGDNVWSNWGYRATIFDGSFEKLK